MHGFPWYFGLLLHPATWAIAVVVVVVLIAYVMLRIRLASQRKGDTDGSL